MLFKKLTLPLVLLAALAVVALAQPPLSPSSIAGQDATFAGFDPLGRPTYTLGVDLVPHSSGWLVFRLVDLSNPASFMPPTWLYVGESAEPVRVETTLAVPEIYRGPVYFETAGMGPTTPAEQPGYRVGPLQIFGMSTGVTPYGRVDLDRNRLAFHVLPGACEASFMLRVYNAPALAPGVIAASPYSTDVLFHLGRLYVGPAPLVVLPPLHATEDGLFGVDIKLPPELIGATFYMQAACDSMDDSLDPIFFSNGVRYVGD